MITREEIDVELIRFAPTDQQAELVEIDQAVKDLLHSYTAFKERLAHIPAANQRDQRTIALHLNMARLVENLDGCRLATLGGRPPVAKAALRMMYEGWTNILLIGYHQGSVSPNNANRRTKIDDPATQQYFAERFQGFATFARWELHKHKIEVNSRNLVGNLANRRNVTIADVQARIQELENEAATIADRFGFNQFTTYWHPFKGANGLKSHLWPKDSPPIFPAADFGISRDTWQDMYDVAYRLTSHEIHGSPVALLSRFGPQNGIDGLVHDRTYYDPEPLRFATGFLVWGAMAFAGALDVVDAFRASFT